MGNARPRHSGACRRLGRVRPLASFRNIVALFTFSVWIFYGLTAVALLILRRRGVGEPVAWRAPWGWISPAVVLCVGPA